MNVRHINPFLLAIENVLAQFGVTEVNRGTVYVKEEMVIEEDVSAFVGIVGDIRGNIAFTFTEKTAKNLASTLMMGMPVNQLDEMSRSAISEAANIFAGNAGGLLEQDNVKIDITPPSVVVGENVFMVLSSVQTLIVTMATPLGDIKVNISLET